jgi:hypothetical protein
LSQIQFSQGVDWCSANLVGSTITISYNITGLANGTYDALLPVNASQAAQSPVNLPISLVVSGGGSTGTVIIPSFTLPNGMGWSINTQSPTGLPTDPVSGLTVNNTNPATLFHGGAADHFASTSGEFNSALAAATDGQIIEITAHITGVNFALRNRGTSGRVWIRSSGYASLPSFNSDYLAAGYTHRLDRTNATHMAALKQIRVTGVNNYGIVCQARASGYVLTGIEVLPNTDYAGGTRTSNALVNLGQQGLFTTTVQADLVKDIMLDRCYVHGNPVDPIKPDGNAARGVWIDGERITVCGSIIESISFTDGIQNSENQSINGVQFRYGLIYNNHIDGRTENMGPWGGGSQAVNLINGYLASDIAFIRNYCPKFDYIPVGRADRHSVGVANGAWVKNLFEIKGGERFLVFGCIFRNFWYADQTRSMVQTPDITTWSRIRDIHYIGCIFELIDGGTVNWHTRGSGAFNNLGSSRVEMMHCHWVDVTPGSFSKFELQGGPTTTHNHFDSLHIHHNTFDHNNYWIGQFSQLVNCPDFWFRDNTFKRAATFGPIFGTNGSNSTALNTHCGVGNWDVRRNFGISGNPFAQLDATLTDGSHGNQLTTSAALFQDAANSNWRVKPAFQGLATDGTDPGCNFDFLAQATANVRA